MKIPEIHDFEYVSEFGHWFASIENEWVDVLIPTPDAQIFPEHKFNFLKFAEPVIDQLITHGKTYIQQFTALDLQQGELNSIRYNELNGIAYIELQYVFENDPNYLWSAGFEKNPLQGYLLDIKSAQLDYGFSAIILHREPL